VFKVYLLASESRQELETKDTIPQPVVTHAKIMIMDDEDMVRSVAKRALSQKGYDVVLAKDGDAAILLYQEALKAGEPIDLVIMDLTIPGGMGGKECVRKIHRIEPGAKVIVCSGYSNNPVMADFKAHGFLTAISKPFQIGELTQVVAGVLSR